MSFVLLLSSQSSSYWNL